MLLVEALWFESPYASGAVFGLCSAGPEGEAKILRRWASPEHMSANILAGLRFCSAQVFLPGLVKLIMSTSASREQKTKAIDILDVYGSGYSSNVRRYGAKEVSRMQRIVINTMFSVLEDPDPRIHKKAITCLLYTSPSPRDATLSRMPSSA